MTSFKATVIVSLLMLSFIPSGLAVSATQYNSTATRLAAPFTTCQLYPGFNRC